MSPAGLLNLKPSRSARRLGHRLSQLFSLRSKKKKGSKAPPEGPSPSAERSGAEKKKKHKKKVRNKCSSDIAQAEPCRFPVVLQPRLSISQMDFVPSRPAPLPPRRRRVPGDVTHPERPSPRPPPNTYIYNGPEYQPPNASAPDLAGPHSPTRQLHLPAVLTTQIHSYLSQHRSKRTQFGQNYLALRKSEALQAQEHLQRHAQTEARVTAWMAGISAATASGQVDAYECDYLAAYRRWRQYFSPHGAWEYHADELDRRLEQEITLISMSAAMTRRTEWEVQYEGAPLVDIPFCVREWGDERPRAEPEPGMRKGYDYW